MIGINIFGMFWLKLKLIKPTDFNDISTLHGRQLKQKAGNQLTTSLPTITYSLFGYRLTTANNSGPAQSQDVATPIYDWT